MSFSPERLQCSRRRVTSFGLLQSSEWAEGGEIETKNLEAECACIKSIISLHVAHSIVEDIAELLLRLAYVETGDYPADPEGKGQGIGCFPGRRTFPDRIDE